MSEVYAGTVVEVSSADDLWVNVDICFDNLLKKQRVRLSGVDAPRVTKEANDIVADSLRSYVRQLCMKPDDDFKPRQVRVHLLERRNASWIVRLEVRLPNGTLHDLNQDLIDRGYAYKKVIKDGGIE